MIIMKKTKYFILIFILMLIGSLTVHAEIKELERNAENNYGVNKKWTIDERNINNVKETPYVDSSEKIYDFANILDDKEKSDLKQQIAEFQNKTNMEFIILTINEPYNYDSRNEEIASDFYDYNDFGLDIPKYSGVVFLRNAYANDPYYDIYTFGEAQLYFSYERLQDVLDDIYYDIKNKNYYAGMSNIIDSFLDYYDDGIEDKYKDKYVDENGYVRNKDGSLYFPNQKVKTLSDYIVHFIVAFVIAFVITEMIIKSIVNRNIMVHKATLASEYLNKDSIKFTARHDKLVNSITTHYTIPSSSSSSGGGGSYSHSGSSGGGHSSGGGRHG